ncbi:MAG: sensor histidine kinase [Aliihoeflea sp.]
MRPITFRNQFSDVADACALAQAIVDTVREPVIVLDDKLRVIAASRSFYSFFKVSPEETQGLPLFELGDGQWDIPGLRVLLEKIVPEHGIMQDYEVEHEFPALGYRTMCLNARQVFYEGGAESTILLSIEDITERLEAARHMEGMLRYKEALLDEMEHRMANSLQIIASIILMRARTVTSEETRLYLKDAHKRVVSVAALQKKLRQFAGGGDVEMAPYLSSLCEALADSMIGDERKISLDVVNQDGNATAPQAESLGLIATELVMNALKHAFAADMEGQRIRVSYEVDGENWKLSVADNGIGKPDGVFAQAKTGLGTGIVKALAQQLDAVVETVADANGTCVTITHATFAKTANSASARVPTAQMGRRAANSRSPPAGEHGEVRFN